MKNITIKILEVFYCLFQFTYIGITVLMGPRAYDATSLLRETPGVVPKLFYFGLACLYGFMVWYATKSALDLRDRFRK